jgi:hypothetical protein
MITNAEATNEQKTSKAPERKGLYIPVCRQAGFRS